MATEIVTALSRADLPALERFVDPAHPIVLAPSCGGCTCRGDRETETTRCCGQITDVWQTDRAHQLNAADLTTRMADRRKRLMAWDTGSGEELRMTFAAYFRRYIHDRPYGRLKPVIWHRDGYTIVTYWHPGKGGMWRSLNLVFKGRYLRGLMHNEWMI